MSGHVPLQGTPLAEPIVQSFRSIAVQLPAPEMGAQPWGMTFPVAPATIIRGPELDSTRQIISAEANGPAEKGWDPKRESPKDAFSRVA